MNRRKRKKLSERLVGAAMTGRSEQAAALLRLGADPQRADRYGTTPLYAASVHGAADIVRMLLAAGADPNVESRGDTDGTPLCGAACWGHADAVRELPAHGADPNLAEDQELNGGIRPLYWARRGPHPEVEAMLIAAGADPTR